MWCQSSLGSPLITTTLVLCAPTADLQPATPTAPNGTFLTRQDLIGRFSDVGVERLVRFLAPISAGLVTRGFSL